MPRTTLALRHAVDFLDCVCALVPASRVHVSCCPLPAAWARTREGQALARRARRLAAKRDPLKPALASLVLRVGPHQATLRTTHLALSLPVPCARGRKILTALLLVLFATLLAAWRLSA